MSAYFSRDRMWRYSLTRDLREFPCDCFVQILDGAGQHSPGCSCLKQRTLTFVGLNPSTADETTDDPTIRRCLGFARRWYFDRLKMVNLYAYRATKPPDLWLADDPVGPENDRILSLVFEGSHMVVAAWGVNARDDRLAAFSSLFARWQFHALGLTKGSAPRHPLYMRADVEPIPFALPVINL